MSVEVEVRSQLTKIVDDLQAIQKAAQALSAQMGDTAENVGKKAKEQTRSVKTAMQEMQDFGRRVADQLKNDFKSLASIGSLTAGLKLSNQFAGSAKEAVDLSDTVRRLGSVFGIAGKDFASFQSLLQSGLGQIGLSSESAANALKGLAETPVRGQANLLAYAKTAGELASISGQKGQEGEIAKGAAGIITARGGNVNDTKQLDAVSREILQIRQATGKSVTDITSALQNIYSKTNKDFQGNLKNGGSTSLASASLLGGPQATTFLEKYLGMNRIERKGLEAQGFKGIVGSNGELNVKAIQATMQEAKGRGLGDAQAGLKTFGLGDEEAKGFIRLAEALQQNEKVINGASKSVVDLNDEYRKTMSLGDSFRASINKVKGIFSAPIAGATQGLSNLLGKASGSTSGAIGVTAGAGVLAAVLAGGGIRGLLGGAIGGELKAKAIEAATGEKVQKVEVINFPASFGGASGLASKAGGLLSGGALATAGTVAAGVGALAAGAYAGTKLEPLADAGLKKVAPGVDAGIQSFVDMLYQKFSGFQPVQRVHVEMKSKDLRQAKPPGRGVSS